MTIGHLHQICEDYIRSGWRNYELKMDLPYAILSDGCSGAPDTDIGARLLVKEAELMLLRNKTDDISKTEVFSNLIAEKGKSFNLISDNFYATLGILELVLDYKIKPEGEIVIQPTLYGDGVIAAKYRNGDIEIYQREYSSGAPYYLMYDRNETTQKNYKDTFGTENHVNYTKIKSNGEITHKNINYLPDQLLYSSPLKMSFYKEEVEFVAIMSDGISSFRDEVNILIPVEEILKEVFAFKNISPNFLKRRMKKSLLTFQERRWKHADDISIGIVYLD